MMFAATVMDRFVGGMPKNAPVCVPWSTKRFRIAERIDPGGALGEGD